MANGHAPNRLAGTADWTTHEWVHFIRGLENPDLEQLMKFDNAFLFSQTTNAEIMAAWMQPAIRAGYTANDFEQHAADFLISVGRRKFLTPTYRAMLESGKRDWALAIYAQARPNYHAVSRETMDDLLNYEGSES